MQKNNFLWYTLKVKSIEHIKPINWKNVKFSFTTLVHLVNGDYVFEVLIQDVQKQAKYFKIQRNAEKCMLKRK